MVRSCGFAEKRLVDAGATLPLPPERSFEEGSALILTYATSIHALVDRGRLEAGQTLLVLGAAGGVGRAAVELGKAFGARVIGAVSSAEKTEEARAAGAGEVFVYPSGPFERDQSKALATPFNDVVEPVGTAVTHEPTGSDSPAPAKR